MDRPLKKMFLSVPPSYDVMNRLLTLRLDEAWRKKAVMEILKEKPLQVLDLCTGTGDLALRLRKQADTDTEINGLDYSPPMLDVARKKANKRKLSDIKFIHGDAAHMPFTEGHFDAIGIAFAFRNLTFKNPDTATFLAEILRVLKPGGKFVIAETSQPSNKLLRALYHLYMKSITAPLGGLLSGHRAAYHYLAWSAIHYLTAEELADLLLNAGFRSVKSRPLLGGIAALTVAVK
jgi:demethylmenaquinone methyltransferase / 2-methoxy-6-polyprenyl-1,4-benzoquinol methylase